MQKIGLVIADVNEFDPIEEYSLKNGGKNYKFNSDRTAEFKIGNIDVIATNCGVGKVNAANGAAALIYGKGVDAIINFGLSGAISGVHKGELAIASKMVEYDFDFTPLGYKPAEKPQEINEYYSDKTLAAAIKEAAGGMSETVLVTGDIFLADADYANRLHELFGAGCCDMEGAAIASVCYKAGIPFACFRSMSDDANDVAITEYREQNELRQTDMLEVAHKAIELLSAAN